MAYPSMWYLNNNYESFLIPVPEEIVDVVDLGTTFDCIKVKFNSPSRFNAPKQTYEIKVCHPTLAYVSNSP